MELAGRRFAVGMPRRLRAGSRSRVQPARLPRPRTVISALALAALLGAGWLWVRDSSLAAVNNATIIGVSGPHSGEIRAALATAAHEMTTLHPSAAHLRHAVAAYPQVKSVTVKAHPLHDLTVTVLLRPAVAVLALGSEHVPVAADGTVLRGLAGADRLPSIRASVVPGARLTRGPGALELAAVAAAPAAMRAHLGRVFLGSQGLEADLGSSGPQVILGDGQRLRAKWIAAARVLGDSGAQGARYLDVRLPERPVAGGLPTGQPSTGG